MATKPQLGLHEKALKAFGVIVRTKKEEKAHEVDRYFFARRKEEEVNHIKPLLEEMQTAFERGEEIGGCRSLKSYCKAWKWSGVLSYARCRQILTGKNGNESKDKSVKSLDPQVINIESLIGKTLVINGEKFTLSGHSPVDIIHTKKLPKRNRPTYTHWVNLNLKAVDVLPDLVPETTKMQAAEGCRTALDEIAADGTVPTPTVTVTLKKAVEGEYGTKLRTEAANAAYGDKKVSKKVYQRIYAGLEQYYKYWQTQQPPIPERPENATVKTQHDLTGNGCHMIAETSPEYDAWQAADTAAHLTPEYTAWNKERSLIVDMQSALINRYDPLTDADLDGDEDGEELEAE